MIALSNAIAFVFPTQLRPHSVFLLDAKTCQSIFFESAMQGKMSVAKMIYEVDDIHYSVNATAVRFCIHI